MSKELNIYDLMRQWFDFCFENPESINPNHSALYFFILSHSNRLGWKPKFGLPTSMAKEAIGIKSYNTYKKTLEDIVSFGFVKMLEKSSNQYSSNIVAISYFDKPLLKALNKATINHSSKQIKSNTESISSIIIPIQHNTNLPINNKEIEFQKFWNLYDKKIDSKKCLDKFLKLSEIEVSKILEVVEEYVKSTPEKKFRKNPLTWLNGSCWNDEIQANLTSANGSKEEETMYGRQNQATVEHNFNTFLTSGR